MYFQCNMKMVRVDQMFIKNADNYIWTQELMS